MEPRVRFARTTDGGAVAFWELGEGPPLLHLPWLPWGHAQLECQDPELSLWYERLSSVCRLIRYDGRGSGLSDWEAESYGIDTQICDIEAVRDRLELDRFALLASLNMGPAAITLASKYPDKVSCLLLWCTYAAAPEYNRRPQVASIRSLLDSDWNLYTETGAHAFVGWPAGDAAHKIADLMRQSTTPEIVKQFYADMAPADATGLLSSLRVPTVVMHPREFSLIDVAAARHLAAEIPDSRMLLFEGSSLSPTRGDLDGVVSAIADVLRETVAPGEDAPSVPRTALQLPSTHGGDGLSAREVEVLQLVAQGRSNREIADLLVISPRTVERHMENIYAKIGVNNRVQASAYAISNGIA
jgi:DNA-binding CsgD family transcriptional regulator/pimeloyl-ACP methyl ester carboxylesterase